MAPRSMKNPVRESSFLSTPKALIALKHIWIPCPRLPRASNGFCQIRLDRKSTRLNSSHSQISYAVFCLKKIHRGDLAAAHRVDVVGRRNRGAGEEPDFRKGIDQLQVLAAADQGLEGGGGRREEDRQEQVIVRMVRKLDRNETMSLGLENLERRPCGRDGLGLVARPGRVGEDADLERVKRFFFYFRDAHRHLISSLTPGYAD